MEEKIKAGRQRVDTKSDDTRPNKGSSAPPKNDPSGRPLTEDERIDEAIRESFGTSDPPSYSSPTAGAPKKRQGTKKMTKKTVHESEK